MHGTFFGDFPGLPWFPELVGTLILEIQAQLDVYFLWNKMENKYLYVSYL